jgi:hypothetical protein
MKTIKSITRTDYSIWLAQYPNESYCVGYSTKKETKVSQLLMYLGDAMEVFDGLLDYMQTGGDLQ